MRSSHSVLTSGAPSGIGAVNADCFARGGSDARPVGRDRGRTRAELRRRIRMNGQGPANLEEDIRLENALQSVRVSRTNCTTSCCRDFSRPPCYSIGR